MAKTTKKAPVISENDIQEAIIIVEKALDQLAEPALERPAQHTLPEVSTEEYISKQLQQYNVTDAKLAEIRQQCASISIAGIEDKEGYQKASEAIRLLKDIYSGVTKKHKELKEVPLRVGRAIDGEKNRLHRELEAIMNPLVNRKAQIDDEIERLRLDKFNRRTKELFDAGCTYNGVTYAIGQFCIDAKMVNDLDDLTFANQVAIANAEKKRVDDERLQLEALRSQQAAQPVQPIQHQQPQPFTAQAFQQCIQQPADTTPYVGKAVPLSQIAPPSIAQYAVPQPTSPAPAADPTTDRVMRAYRDALAMAKQNQKAAMVVVNPDGTTFIASHKGAMEAVELAAFKKGIEKVMARLNDPTPITRNELINYVTNLTL